MKNLLFLVCLVCAFAVNGQQYVITMTGSGDTITNTTADSVYYTVSNYAKSVSIHATFTRISGTAAGKAELYGSIDGSNYKQIGTDTLAMAASGTSSYVWIVDNNAYRKYKVVFTGSTTLTGSINGYLFAQTIGGKGIVSEMSTNGTTVTNSGTGTVSIQVKNQYEVSTIQVVCSKTSGTIGGTVTLQGSNDGTNYVTVNTSYISGGSATLSCSNVSINTRMFIITGSPYRYYRLSWTGSGTMAGKLYGYILPQK
jgi:hypothetical protein